MASYLVTGGAGFIGSHLVDALVERGDRVRVLDNFSTGKRKNLRSVIQQVELIEGDTRDLPLCCKATEGVEFVFHLAALHEVVRSVEEPLETHQINATGTMNILLAARDAHVKRLVFASSSAVYGDSPIVPRAEKSSPLPFSSPYSASKLIGEFYCRLFSGLYSLETVCLRFFNVYGPRQDSASQYASVIPKFISALRSGTAPVIFGDGEQSRDFIFIADCIEAVLRACYRPGISGSVFNVGTGRQTTVNQLCHLLQRILGTNFVPRLEAPRPGDIRHDYAEIEMARQALGYEPRWDMYQGLMETVEWYMKNDL